MSYTHRDTPHMQLGFSLMELMIVVVIIAILASIAIPGFQDQLARSQVMAAHAELRALTTPYEDHLMRGFTAFDLGDLGLEAEGLQTQTSRCLIDLTLPDESSGSGELTCQIQGNSRIIGTWLRMVRSPGIGRWQCQSNLEDALRPEGCQPDVL